MISSSSAGGGLLGMLNDSAEWSARLVHVQQLRQLGDVDGHPPRFVAGGGSLYTRRCLRLRLPRRMTRIGKFSKLGMI